jgi:RimJ/RimL family protein N-acetyltransferase
MTGGADPPRARMRIAGPGDAAALLKLKQRLDRETSFMLLEADERDASVPAVADELAAVTRAGNSAVIVAESGDEMVGYVELTGGAFRRNRATAYLVIGVLAQASGQGVGTGLLAEAMRWAASAGLHRLELTVMAHNHRAIGLYERIGFRVEGRRSQCLIIDGRFADELYMAVILDPA